METVTMKVDGMTCGGCVASVTRVLKSTPGVADAIVRLESGSAEVTFDPARVSRTQITERIAALGYTVRGEAG